MSEVTPEILTKIESYMGTVKTQYDTNKAYVKGKNPPTLDPPKKGDPDNRIPIPLAKTTVEDMAGYAGRAEDRLITFPFVDSETDPDTNEYEAIVKPWMDYNDDGVEVSELYKEALWNGKSYELWWTSENDEPGLPIKPEYKIVPGDSIFVKWSSDVKPRMQYAVRFWKDTDQFDGVEDTKHYAMVYYEYVAEAWESNGAWYRVPENDVVYPYSIVPVIEYKINKDGESLFESEKSMIDAIDKIVSKSTNEVDRYNALILLLPFLADANFKQKLMELKIIDNLSGQGDNPIIPQFLEKNLAGVTEFYKWALDTLVEFYHKSTKVPDFTDQKFGGSDESGEAKRMKLLGMEYVAAQIDTYFLQGIFKRKQLFDDVINAGTTGINTDDYTISVACQRNLPVNEKERLEIASLEMGIGITKQTIINGLPRSIVPDPRAELEAMDSQREKVTVQDNIDDNPDNQDNDSDDQ